MARIGLAAFGVMMIMLAVATSAHAAPDCGVKLDGAGKPITFATPLGEDAQKGLMAGIYLAAKDETGRGTWPASEIDVALPCPIAEFEEGDATWVIFAGEASTTPVRWAKAEGRDDFFYLAEGPSLDDARTWSMGPRTGVMPAKRATYYLAGVADKQHFVFRVYGGAPSTKLLADDLADIIKEKTAPIAVYDPEGYAVSLFLTTASRRTAELFRPEALVGKRTASLTGPDGRFFSPAPGEAVILRGSDFTCPLTFGAFERGRLGVIDPEDAQLDLLCTYHYGDSWLSAYIFLVPDARQDASILAASLKETQKEVGFAGRLPSFKTGAREAVQGGRAWVDKSGTGQGLWLLRRGDYLIELHATFAREDSERLLDAAEALIASTAPGDGGP